MNNVKQFEELLNHFSKIKIQNETPPTLMEIAGFPRWENVCSNILAFYLEPNNEHGLDDLVLSSLMQLPEVNLNPNEYNLTKTKVNREVVTDKNNRLDLVIENENFIIGIENKIDAALYNDLDDYKTKLDQIAKEKQIEQVRYLVLSPDKQTKLNSSFLSITYKDLFLNIKKKIVDKMAVSSNKYSTFLIDFINTIEKKSFIEQNREFISFCRKNNDAINRFLKDHNQLVQGCYNEIKGKIIKTLNSNNIGFKPFTSGQWKVEGFDIFIANSNIRFQYSYPINEGWKFHFLDLSKEYLPQLQTIKISLENQGYKFDSSDNNIIISFDLFELEDVSKFVVDYITTSKQILS